MAVSVVTDSTTYIPSALIDELHIDVVSLYIYDGDRHELESEMDYQAFYHRLEDMEVLPKSALPSPETIKESFMRIIERGDDVLAVFLSSEMSGTVEAANMVADMIRKEHPEARITVVDSETNSMQEGYAVLAGARAAAAGATLEECEKAARDTMARSRFIFAPQTLEYLKRGGRIGRASALLGTLIKLVPILTVENAVTSTYAKVRTYPKALATMRDKMLADAEAAGGFKNVCLHYICDKALAEMFQREYIEPALGHKVDLIALGPVIGTHVGPAVGIVYETVNPLR